VVHAPRGPGAECHDKREEGLIAALAPLAQEIYRLLANRRQGIIAQRY